LGIAARAGIREPSLILTSIPSTGLYLYLLVVETFSRIEVINKFVIYAVVGYGECASPKGRRS
jgi:hypothetical protein